MDQDVAEFAPFMDRTRGGHADMAGNAAWGGELAEQLVHAFGVRADSRVDFRIGSFEVDVRHQGRTAVAGAGQVHGIDVVLGDQAIHMHVDEIQTG